MNGPRELELEVIVGPYNSQSNFFFFSSAKLCPTDLQNKLGMDFPEAFEVVVYQGIY
jgi:hypothetical protein